MQKRKSHNKSRKGCQNCKKKHVKCDEQGPPCANCVARKTTTTCIYQSDSLTVPSDASSASGSDIHISSTASTASDSRRLSELELLHRWTTQTYKSMCTMPEDQIWLQMDVPRWAFKDDYLLDAILAISALETAVCEPDIGEAKSAVYIQAAMEYYDKGSASFRKQLFNIDKMNVHSVYAFSCLAWAINMAMPQVQQQGILARIVILMELAIGSSAVALRSYSSLMDGPIGDSLRVVMASLLEQTAPNLLDSTTKMALARLESVVESSIAMIVSNGDDNDATLTRVKLYRNAVSSLRTCFVEEAKGSYRGFCMAFPSLLGKNFVIAVKNSEPVPLFILMHWAVLLDGVASNYWWGLSLGRDLVLEISDTLLQPKSLLAVVPECQDSVAWAREQVVLSESSKRG